MPLEPVVLHFNDCAFVARSLVRAARRQGLNWGYLPPAKVRPDTAPSGGLDRLRYVPFVARRRRVLRPSDVVHVHYATSVRLIHERLMPRRPYLLHLHGTDIREQWGNPRYRDEITRAIDGAERVYYTNLDTADQARAARPDAEYMPAFIDLSELPPWRPEGGSQRVLFSSRWSRVKGAETNIALAARLRRALPAEVRILGLDWGESAADARSVGVELLPRGTHERYLALLATADVVVGQATGLLGVSELEAMAIGVPVVAPGPPQHDHPDGGAPPVLLGTADEAVAQIRWVLADPPAAGRALDAPRWVAQHYSAGRFVAPLQAAYRDAAERAGWPGRRRN